MKRAHGMDRKNDPAQSPSPRNHVVTNRRELLKIAGVSILGLAGAGVVPAITTGSENAGGDGKNSTTRPLQTLAGNRRRSSLMQIRPVNSQTWLAAFNLNQAIEVTAGQRVLYVSGQASNDASGAPIHAGDLVAQFKLAWKNLVEVLGAANMKPENIVRLNVYTTDVDRFMAKSGEMVPIFAKAGCKPVSTLLGVARLFQPSLMVELEATAVA
jgi:enamine deaminase RidA (YjgF/YER057c/UK114 family)